MQTVLDLLSVKARFLSVSMQTRPAMNLTDANEILRRTHTRSVFDIGQGLEDRALHVRWNPCRHDTWIEGWEE